MGETVGYRVRFDSKVSRRTRIEVVTEGVLVQRLQRDPALVGKGGGSGWGWKDPYFRSASRNTGHMYDARKPTVSSDPGTFFLSKKKTKR